jgi:hypothetical protein
MAPNTGLAFMCSAGIILLLLSAHKEVLFFAASAAALASLTVALAGLLGYALQLESIYGWGDFTRMAVHTAILHSLLSYTILRLLTSRLAEMGKSHALLQILSFLGVSMAISTLLFFATYQAEAKQLHASLKREATSWLL